MPSSLNSGPFLSLRPDHDCGRSKVASPKSFSSLSGSSSPAINGNGYSHTNGHGHLNGVSNGLANGHRSNASQDEFLRLDAPQQDLLLLHGPRQKYKLEHSRDIPDLQGEREILVQVLAIGLNPVDWKGADYGFSQPSYPWVNGRDFAGIVVRACRTNSRVQQGDIVFGPSTDYRDVRKAAYQEYVVTTDYNVSRIPQGVDVKEGAALGVAWVAAVVSLGISFGLDFSNLRNAPQGPDLVKLVRHLDPRDVGEDIREEIFAGIAESERPQPGEWIAIWGANSMTGQVALQLAKHAGLKVACIADIARGGARLSELGADFMVDKYDNKRAVEILKAVTGGKLRFGFDCNGKESATSLQEALTQSESGLKSHLLGLTGLPKNVGKGVVHHKIPIKIFHEAPHVGEAISTWLEELLIARSLKLPEVEVAQGGLAGINDALDRMRTGTIGGRRIVVAVGSESKESSPQTATSTVPNGISATTDIASQDLSYADSINSDPNRVRFAYWVPNVSGGLVISKIPQRTHWDLKSNQKYAKTAERVGFEYALSQIRFMAGYGADNQHEPVTFSQALLMSTERLKLIVALLPGPWNPAVAAKQVACIDNYSEGRVCVNIVSGWFKLEFTSIGQWWLDHAERYRRSKEFIQCLKGIWTQDSFSFKGDFYQFHDYPLKPKPLNLPGRPYPEIFQGGNSDDAKENAGSVSDYYFMNGNTLQGFQSQINDVKERAKKNGREGECGFALNAFVICRETEEEALRVLAEIQGKADVEAVEGFRQQVANAGSSTANKSGMWANSKLEDLVQYNDGFKTKLIGTKEQIAERIVMLKSLGVNIILTAFLHYEEEIEQFGREVLPLVRELEKQGRGVDTEDEIRRTGHIYDAKKPDAGDANTISPSTPTSRLAAAAAKSIPAAAVRARPFTSLMPTTPLSFVSAQLAANEPHRPFPPTHRNPGGDLSSTQNRSIFQPKQLNTTQAAKNSEAHQPFPPTHRNPDVTQASAAENKPHQPFSPEKRNPDPNPAAKPHRPFSTTFRNPEPVAEKKQETKQKTPGSVGAVGKSQQKPHRAFEPGYRNPEASREVQPHRPFSTTVRNPEPVAEQEKDMEVPQSVDTVGKTKPEPHRAFETAYRNPQETGSQAQAQPEPHRPFNTTIRNPEPIAERQTNKKDEEGLPSVYVVGESQQKPYFSFGPRYRNPDVVADAQPHRAFETGVRNPLEERTPGSVSEFETTEQKQVAALPQSVDATGTTHQQAHHAFEPTLRNLQLDEREKSHQSPNEQHTTTNTEMFQTAATSSSTPLKFQSGNIDSREVSPAPSEKSFETAEGGSSGVHVRLDESGVAENGEALFPKTKTLGPKTETAASKDENLVEGIGERALGEMSSPRTSGVKSTEGKKERGLLKGLRNSLRRR